jgi:mRNA interferase RelE/StbE
MYDLQILEAAENDLARLDTSIARRIVKRVQWLAEHLDELKPEPLTATLLGFFKLRVGDYRIIYRIIANENLIVVHRIGHRREIYR